MPPLEKTDRPHTAVYWEQVGRDRYNNPRVGEPIELMVRWTERIRTITTQNGSTRTTTVRLVTDRRLTEDSMVWRGAFNDIPGTGSDFPEENIYQVVASGTTSDIKGRASNTRYTADLAPYTDTFPQKLDEDI